MAVNRIVLKHPVCEAYIISVRKEDLSDNDICHANYIYWKTSSELIAEFTTGDKMRIPISNVAVTLED